MKTATLTLNGREYEVQLTDEQAQELTAPKKVTGFERVKADKIYFHADGDGEFSEDYEGGVSVDDRRYQNANYYSDATIAEWCIRNDTLNRKMRRWAAEHNTEPIDWNKRNDKYYIYYDYEESRVAVYDAQCCAHIGEIFFFDYVTAKEAIKEFGEEIKWLAENRPKWF